MAETKLCRVNTKIRNIKIVDPDTISEILDQAKNLINCQLKALSV